MSFVATRAYVFYTHFFFILTHGNFKLFEISKTKTEHGIISSVYFFPFGFHLGPFGFHLGSFWVLLGPFGFLLGPFGFFWVLLGESTHPCAWNHWSMTGPKHLGFLDQEEAGCARKWQFLILYLCYVYWG